MQATIADIIGEMEKIAPSRLAEAWDNVGLQVGRRSWPVKRIWTALDPMPTVVEAACRDGVDLLITHHPLIFRPLTAIDIDTPGGRVIARAVRCRLGIYAAHSNLDSAAGGLNDLLAQRAGLSGLSVLRPFVGPPRAAAGTEGAPGAETGGLGRIGCLDRQEPLPELARRIQRALGLGSIRVAGAPDLVVQRVALCTGSGSSLMSDFLASDAQVYLSGDLRYHDARSAEEHGRGLIDIGHFGSESLMIHDLAQRLSERLKGAGYDVSVTPCELERDPFATLI